MDFLILFALAIWPATLLPPEKVSLEGYRLACQQTKHYYEQHGFLSFHARQWGGTYEEINAPVVEQARFLYGEWRRSREFWSVAQSSRSYHGARYAWEAAAQIQSWGLCGEWWR